MVQEVMLRLCAGFVKTIELFLLTLAGAIPLGLIVAFGSMSKFKPLKIVVVTMEEEMGGLYPQVKGCWQPAARARSKEWRLP